MILKKSILLCLLTLASLQAMAQRGDRGADREKLDAARVAFITNRLNLTPDQAEKFWPLYNRYNDQRMALMKKSREINQSADENLSDAKASELIAARFTVQDDLLKLEKTFMEEVTSAISPSQAFKLSNANRDFTRQLYQMQQRRGGRQD
ncbi:Spy/CpxP family protein refolding chaperone [Lunatimonas salinarum]|uniref:Spy/CpxP family protein refolding chaperone n=1 Tax=Lunatimonas salinarum TaxID=1774590 RepID=UPI001FD75089|nr:Spy/CpxP family protein refolding chaperone [Lunatimonas salinarum]